MHKQDLRIKTSRLLAFACVAAISTLLISSPAYAQTVWRVDDDALNDPAPGDTSISDPLEDGTPEHPFDAIQEAIDASADGDEVVLADGVYSGAGNRHIRFYGKAITLRSENGPEECIIDVRYQGWGVSFYEYAANTSVLQGLTIKNSMCAIYCLAGEPIILDCRLLDTYAEMNGAVRCENSAPTIRRCEIADSTGAGIWCRDSSPLISDCVVTGNHGSGIYCTHSNPTIVNCRIHDNENLTDQGLKRGGGIRSVASDAVIVGCLITGNRARYGGGISTSQSVIIEGCTIADNMAPYGGAVSIGAGATSSLSNSILWGNGTGICEEVRLYSATLDVVGCNIMGGEEEVAILREDAVLNWLPGNIDSDPLFLDPDGPDDDPTTWADNDYRLVVGSPCIDAGSNCAVPLDWADLDHDGDTDELIPFDLEGEGRFFDDPATPDTGAGLAPIVDIGAYEFGGSEQPACPGDLDGDRDVDLTDLAELLANYGLTTGADSYQGDLDCDRDVDLSDLAELLARYGDPCD